MIRINLATGKVSAMPALGFSSDVAYTPAELQKQALIRLGIIVLFPVLLWAYERNTLPGLMQERNSLQDRLNEVQSYNAKAENSVREIKKIKEDEAKIQARINFLETLSKTRLREIKVLDLIQQVIPEKVWLTRVEGDEDKILLSGMAMTDFEISAFMEALSKSVYFRDVKLLSSNELVYDSINVKRFEISCVLEKPSS